MRRLTLQRSFDQHFVLTASNIDNWCGGVLVGRRFAAEVYGEGRGGGRRWCIASVSKNLVHQV